jgi:DNA-binding beta-propeller fold protein YncE
LTIQRLLRRVGLAGALALVASSITAAPASAETVVPTLVREVQTSRWTPHSPDPMGIAYQPATKHLLVVDSEVEETSLWKGINIWETGLKGSVLRTSTTWGGTLNFSNEPSDIGVRPSDGHVFIPDDDKHRIFEIALGEDKLLGTADDTVTSVAMSAWGSSIHSSGVEGITFGGSDMYFTDAGSDNDVYRVKPGSNGRFDGAPPVGDDVVSHFDTSKFGQSDPEAIAYNSETKTLYVGSRKVRFISEVSLSGSLIRKYDLSSFADFKDSSGIAFAPSSNDSSGRSIYIVDRRVDNDSTASENDGLLFEFAVRLP